MDKARPKVITALRRSVYIVLGTLFVGLAFLGALLPILPTTPFLLLASFFYIRSAPSLNERLHRFWLFGPLIKDWNRHRGVRLHVKISAVTLILVAVFASAFFGELSWPWLIVLGVLGAIGLYVVLRLPLVRESMVVAEDVTSELSSDSKPCGVMADE